jgi:hypothetical protein
MKIGEIIRNARLQQGMSLGDIREAHWLASALPVARGEWPYHPVARYAYQNCEGHGLAAFAVLFRRNQLRQPGGARAFGR